MKYFHGVRNPVKLMGFHGVNPVKMSRDVHALEEGTREICRFHGTLNMGHGKFTGFIFTGYREKPVNSL